MIKFNTNTGDITIGERVVGYFEELAAFRGAEHTGSSFPWTAFDVNFAVVARGSERTAADMKAAVTAAVKAYDASRAG